MTDCGCTGKNIVFFTCSGAANVGQIANQAAVDLQREGAGSMLCLAGIGSHNGDMISMGRAADRVVGIDGCGVACTKKALEHAGVPLTDYVVVARLGIAKEPHSGVVDAQALARVKDAVRRQLACDEDAAGPY